MQLIRQFKADRSLNPQQQLLKFIRAENKYKSIWQYLKRYQNPNYVKSILKSSFSSLSAILVNKKSQQISDALKMGEAYFDSALKSDLSIKPLLIYYGMLNLVKALVIFGDNKFTLESKDMTNHGLNIRSKPSNNDANIRKDQNNLLEEFCYIANGKSLFKLLHACWSQKDLNTSMRFKIQELVSMHPNSWKAVTDHTGTAPKLFISDGGFRKTTQIEHVVSFSSTTQFLIYQKPASENPLDFFDRIFPVLKTNYHRDTKNINDYISNQLPATIDEMVPLYTSISGEKYTIAEINAESTSLRLNPIEIEFILMFILGSLTRYAPHKWLKNVRYEGGSEMFMLEGILEATLLSFPKMILEEFEGKEYTFAGDVS